MEAPEVLDTMMKVRLLRDLNGAISLGKTMEDIEYLEMYEILLCLVYEARAQEFKSNMARDGGGRGAGTPGTTVMQFSDPSVMDGDEDDDED